MTITGGTEKQNAWAGRIADQWIAQFDIEIRNTQLRPDSDGLAWYLANLEAKRSDFIAGLNKISAKALIDLYTAGRNPVNALIQDAQTKR